MRYERELVKIIGKEDRGKKGKEENYYMEEALSKHTRIAIGRRQITFCVWLPAVLFSNTFRIPLKNSTLKTYFY